VAWPDEPKWQPPAFPAVEEALSAHAVVVEESRRWIVYLDVVLRSGAVRRRVGDYHDERRAVHAARIIERNANRGMRPIASYDTMTSPTDTDDKD
jgi:hypothetical protein